MLLCLALMETAGCHDPAGMPHTAPATPTAPTTPTVPAGSGTLFISGGMGAQGGYFRVSRGGAPATDADVTVNGFPIPREKDNLYVGKLPEPVPAGGTLNLKVVASGVTFEASGEVIALSITAPTAGSTFARADTVTLAWSASMDPERFEVCLNCGQGYLEGGTYPASGSARQFKIAPNMMWDYGEGTVVAVSAVKSNFLQPASSPTGTSEVSFRAASRVAGIIIK